MDIIKTIFKEKIPKGFSYPIGAERISEALVDSINFEICELRFDVKDEYWASSFKDRIKNREPIKIFEIEYHKPNTYHSTAQHMIDSGYYDEKWKISVHSVPREDIAIVRELLQQKLHEVALWLSNRNNREFYWRLYFDPKKGALLTSI